jgi:hypothetical protein
VEAPDGGGGSSRYLTTFSPGAFEQIKRAGRDRGAWCTREGGGRGRLNVAQAKGDYSMWSSRRYREGGGGGGEGGKGS